MFFSSHFIEKKFTMLRNIATQKKNKTKQKKASEFGV